MYCSKCGNNLGTDASFCPNCGTPVPITGPATVPVPGDQASAGPEGWESQPPEDLTKIPTYLPYAILVTVFCCLPFGIPAIVYAARVSSRIAAGDGPGAMAESRNARTWTWVSFWVGLAGVAIYGVMILAGIIAGEN